MSCHPTASLPPQRPSLQSFWQSHMSVEGGRPALLTGCMDHWPAMSAWPDPGHLLRVAGFRTVPVELGSSYLAPEVGETAVGSCVHDCHSMRDSP